MEDEPGLTHALTTQAKEEKVSWGLVVLSVFTLVLLFFLVATKSGFFERWAETQYSGKINEIHEHGFIIQDREAKEKTIVVSPDTHIRKGQQIIAEASLELGSYVIVAGTRINEDQVEARVVRVFPSAK